MLRGYSRMLQTYSLHLIQWEAGIWEHLPIMTLHQNLVKVVYINLYPQELYLGFNSSRYCVGDEVMVTYEDLAYTYTYIQNTHELLVNKTQTLTDSETDYPSGKAVSGALDLVKEELGQEISSLEKHPQLRQHQSGNNRNGYGS